MCTKEEVLDENDSDKICSPISNKAEEVGKRLVEPMCPDDAQRNYSEQIEVRHVIRAGSGEQRTKGNAHSHSSCESCEDVSRQVRTKRDEHLEREPERIHCRCNVGRDAQAQEHGQELPKPTERREDRIEE